MLRKILPLLAGLLLMWSAPGATKQRPPPRKPAAAKRSAAKRPASSKKTTSKKTASSRQTRAKRHVTTWRNRQLQPTPARYAEIQRVLASRGYLTAEATGKWDQASTDALQRFQRDQKLEPTGKLDSLTLIALGFGPKYDTVSKTPPAPPPPP